MQDARRTEEHSRSNADNNDTFVTEDRRKRSCRYSMHRYCAGLDSDLASLNFHNK